MILYNKKEVQILKKLHACLKEDIQFYGSREFLRKLLRKWGSNEKSAKEIEHFQ